MFACPIPQTASWNPSNQIFRKMAALTLIMEPLPGVDYVDSDSDELAPAPDA
jgi:hypothetical protein